MRCMIMDTRRIGPEGYALALSVLSEERRAKAGSYLFEKDRLLSVAAGLFMGMVEAMGCSIRVDENGKPQTDDPRIHFNVSHSGHYAVCAISDMPVGIDIEEIGDNLELCPCVMTPAEMSAFNDSVPENDRNDVFCRMWTVKESVMKALGLGLSLPPDSFQSVFRQGMRHDGYPEGLHVSELPAPEGFHVSACHHEPEEPVSLETVDPMAVAAMLQGR